MAENFLSGGWICWLIVSPISGATWTLKPEYVTVDLRQRLFFNDSESADGIYVVLERTNPNKYY